LTVRTLLELHRVDGQTMAEYSIILAVITPAIVLTISLLSDRIAGLFTALPSLIP
jgi:Flp pilus assembly pilin Flp